MTHGHHAAHFQTRAGWLSTRHAGVLAHRRRGGGGPTGRLIAFGRSAGLQINRQQLAGQLIARPVGDVSQHINMIAKRDQVFGKVVVERAAATNLDRRRRLGDRPCRLGDGPAVGLLPSPAGAGFARHELGLHLKMKALDLGQFQRTQAAHGAARLGFPRRRLGERDQQITPVAVAVAESKGHVVGCPDAVAGQLHVLGFHQQAVAGAGAALSTVDGDLSAQATPYDLADLRTPQVDRPVELEHGALGRFEHDGPLILSGRPAAGRRKEHQRAGLDFEPPVGQ